MGAEVFVELLKNLTLFMLIEGNRCLYMKRKVDLKHLPFHESVFFNQYRILFYLFVSLFSLKEIFL